MYIDDQTLVSISEANQNFTKVARLTDEKGSVVIMKNNMPKYIILPYHSVSQNQNTGFEKNTSIDAAAKKSWKETLKHLKYWQINEYVHCQ